MIIIEWMLKKHIRTFFIKSKCAIDFFDIATPLRRARLAGKIYDEHPGQYVFG